jgi:membrane fusion protein, multidrug efflux system
MVEKQDAGKDQSSRSDAAPRALEGVSLERATEAVQAASVAPANHRPRWKRRLALGVLAAVVLAAIWKYGVPWIELTLNTVSTDDAYVNGLVTFVAARVSGQIARVLVDDNNHVHKGDVLAQLDKEPYEDEVDVKRAAVDTAKAYLQAARAQVRALEAQARSLRWKLKSAMEDVDNRVALLHARVAVLDKSKATFKLAQIEFARAEQLLSEQDISQQQYDQRQAALSVAQAGVTQAMADVYQIRLSLGLLAQPESGDLGEVQPNLD